MQTQQMTVADLLDEIEVSFSKESIVRFYKIECKEPYSIRTIEGPAFDGTHTLKDEREKQILEMSQWV